MVNWLLNSHTHIHIRHWMAKMNFTKYTIPYPYMCIWLQSELFFRDFHTFNVHANIKLIKFFSNSWIRIYPNKKKKTTLNEFITKFFFYNYFLQILLVVEKYIYIFMLKTLPYTLRLIINIFSKRDKRG